MPNNTEREARRRQRRRSAVKTTGACAAVLLLAAVGTLWLQRTFWQEGVLARLLPYTALLYILLLPAMALSLRTKLNRIDEEERDVDDETDDD